jgi:hypothetical protein
MSLIDLARESDRECNRARTADELRDAVHRRRLVRAGMEFERTVELLEQRNPIGRNLGPAPFPIRSVRIL